MIEIINNADTTNITISGGIGSMFENGFTLEQLKDAIPDGVKNVVVDLKTMGGDSFEAISIHDYIKSLPAVVTTRMIGNTASAGFTIWAAGDVREISRNSKGLIHKGQTQTIGNSDDHAKAIEGLNEHDDQIASIYNEATGLRPAIIKSLMQEAKWMNADELMKLNFAHKLIENKTILNQSDMDTTTIKKMLNVDTDEEIEAAITALIEKSSELENSVKNIEEEKEKEKELMIENYIAENITAGKITNETKDQYLALAKADFESTKAILEAARPAPLVANIVTGDPPKKVMDKAEAQKIYNQHKVKNTLARWFEANPEEYKEVNAIIRGK